MPPLLAFKPFVKTYSTNDSSTTELGPHGRTLGDTNSTNNQVRFFAAQGEDQARLTREVEVLLEERGGRWRLTEDGKGIERCFRFKTFDSAWSFMSIIAEKCREKRHHPEWANVYQKTFIRWTTHRPDGLSIKDVEMAAVCDQIGGLHGEIGGSVTGAFGSKGGELVEAVKH